LKNTFFKKFKYQNLILLHILIGVLAISKPFVLVFSSLLLYGVFKIISSKNSGNQALYWCIYAVGSEVLFRMTGGAFFHEYIKYLCMLYLISGIAIERTNRKIPRIYHLYTILLLLSILFAQQETFKSFIQEVSFNLSGPILLGLVAMYSYNRILSSNQIVDLLKVSLLPIVSILAYLFLHTASISQITFVSAANFETTGGFGPNQVSTILGFGIFVFIVLYIYKVKFTNFLIFDFLIFGYLIYRELLTFSRGGLIAGVFAAIIIIYYYLKTKPKLFLSFVRISLITFVFGALIFNYTTEKTGDMLTYRYQGKNTYGDKNEDISSNRIGFINDEFKIFLNNPFFGAGVGGSKYHRDQNSMHKGSTHSEIGRLLSEHGIIGLFLFIFLFVFPLKHIYKYRQFTEYSFSLAFFILWFLTINHSAMRLAFPSVIYGLSLIIIRKNEHIIHR
jgi:O-antigen ligase